MNSIEVGCAVIEKDGNLLIAQRFEDDSFGGLWEFPGGKREEGETLEACLIREIQEELGGEILPRKFLFKRREVFPTRVIELNFYVCDWVGGEPRLLGVQNAAWVKLEELDRYPFIPADLEVIEILIRGRDRYFERSGDRWDECR